MAKKCIPLIYKELLKNKQKKMKIPSNGTYNSYYNFD